MAVGVVIVAMAEPPALVSVYEQTCENGHSSRQIFGNQVFDLTTIRSNSFRDVILLLIFSLHRTWAMGSEGCELC